MAAHRYWRLFCHQHGGAGWVVINELILATVSGGAQAATGGSATASSASGSDVAGRAFDATQTQENYWRSVYSLYDPAWLQYDMGNGNAIDVVEMRIFYNGTVMGGTSTYPNAFSLQYSDDGLNWTVQRAWSVQTAAHNTTTTYDATALPSGEISNRIVNNRSAARYNNAAHDGPPTIRKVLRGAMLMRDGARPVRRTPYTGTYYIAGSTTILGNPAARLVRLVDQTSGLLVSTFYTGADGYYEFEEIAYGPWTLVGVDVSAEQNSVIYAHVVAAPMP